MTAPRRYTGINPIFTRTTATATATHQFAGILPQAHQNHHGSDTRDPCDSTKQDKSSLDFTQRLEKKLAAYNASQNIFKRWLFEIVSCGQEMAQSQELLTLSNTLGKVASAALIVPTSEALGQLKWNWFHESKAMWDFEIFDKASRGAWGAALLLFRTKGRSLAALGALLIVLLLAIDTFFQQVVTFSDRRALMRNLFGTIPRVVDYEPPFTPVYQYGIEHTSEDRALASKLREFFYDNGTQPVPFGNGTRPEIPLSCPTSNCAWPPYETLAVCSDCKDVTGALNLTYHCMNTTIDWSVNWPGPIEDVPYPHGTVCGYYLNATSDAPVLMSGYVVNSTDTKSAPGEALLVRAVPLTNFDTKMPFFGDGSIRFKHIRNPILDALVVSATNGAASVYQKKPPVALECLLSWCIKTLESSYDQGQYTEIVTDTYLPAASEPRKWPWDTFPTEYGLFLLYEQNITLAPPPASRTSHRKTTVFSQSYHLNNNTACNAMNTFDDFFPSSYTAANVSAEPRLRFRNYEGGPMVQELKFNPWQLPNNVTRHMERLAQTMTNVIRSSSSMEMLHGEAFSQEKFFSIHWAWLTFPLLLLLLTLVFLVSTIIKTSKDTSTGMWKNSAMPTLIYSLPTEARSKLDPSSTSNGSFESSKKVRIKLMPNIGWRLSGQGQARPTPPPGWL
ncbi:hypothetical protein ACJQWK_03320 [Exserohilum turcicum]